MRPDWAKPTITIDLRGEVCPIPELTSMKKLKEMTTGVLEVLTDHQAAADVTLPDLARMNNYRFYSEKDGDAYRIFLGKN